jgi:hypothetical protein
MIRQGTNEFVFELDFCHRKFRVIPSSESSLELPFYLANHSEPNLSIVAGQIQAPD